MKRIELNRRDFTKLTVAAFGGVVAGTVIGCGGDGDGDGTGDGTGDGIGDGEGDGSSTTDDEAGDDTAETGESPLLSGKHVCRGMNECKGKGKSGENDCAGTSTCYTANKHTCHGENECKGQGGCEETAGRNSCEKKGECAVPLSEETWAKARAALKVALEKQGKTLGDAPEAG